MAAMLHRLFCEGERDLARMLMRPDDRAPSPSTKGGPAPGGVPFRAGAASVLIHRPGNGRSPLTAH
jgi:hypothetical protein